MKLDSKFFDRLRVKPDAARLVRDACPSCEWQGCSEPGLYPAPKGRGQEGKYHRFCLEHVREYNKSYNYFAGMPDEDVAKHHPAANPSMEEIIREPASVETIIARVLRNLDETFERTQNLPRRQVIRRLMLKLMEE